MTVKELYEIAAYLHCENSKITVCDDNGDWRVLNDEDVSFGEQYTDFLGWCVK